MEKAKVLFALSQDISSNFFVTSCLDLFKAKGVAFHCQTVLSEAEIFQSISSDKPNLVVVDSALDNKEFDLCGKIHAALNEKVGVIPPQMMVLSNSACDGGIHDRQYYAQEKGAVKVLEGGIFGVPPCFADLKLAIDNINLQLATLEMSKNCAKLAEKYKQEKEKALDLANENATLAKQNAELAYKDALTGAYNRGYFNQRFGKFKECTYPNGPQYFALIICDLDNFKQVNDNYGHGMGDNVLKTTFKAIEDSVRESDEVFRWGGEEIAILAKVRTKVGGQILAEKIRAAVEGIELYCGVDKLEITMSVGQIIVQAHESQEDAVEKADTLMYEAKNSGKNCVVSDYSNEGVKVLEQKETECVVIATDFRANIA